MMLQHRTPTRSFLTASLIVLLLAATTDTAHSFSVPRIRLATTTTTTTTTTKMMTVPSVPLPSVPSIPVSVPRIIQGGMGIRISSWELARAVSLKGELGVVSGTGIDTILVRTLQNGKYVFMYLRQQQHAVM
jgi:hypothetical protein